MRRILIFVIIAGLTLCSEFPVRADSNDLINLEYAGSVLWRGIRDLEIRGDYAYLSFRDGLMVMDISNPYEPTFVSKMAFQGDLSRFVEISGNYAYISNGRNGLQIVDISDPYNLELLSSYKGDPPYFNFFLCQIYGNYLYAAVASHGSYLLTLDVSDPYNPIFVDTLETPLPIYSSRVSGNFIYAANNYGLNVVDISNPAEPIFSKYLSRWGQSESPFSIAGEKMYLSYNITNLGILDIFDGSNPDSINVWPTPNQVNVVEADDDYVYMGIYNLGLMILNVADPYNPIIAGQEELEEYLPPFNLQKSGDYLYGSSGSGRTGFEIFDVSDPQAPELISNTPKKGLVLAADVSGNYAFVAEYYGGFSVMDISAPDVDRKVYNWDSASQVCDVNVKDESAYVLDTDDGLVIFDISDPENPVHISSLDCCWAYADRLTIYGDYAFITVPKYYETGGLLQLVNISIPSAPFVEGTLDLGGHPRGSAAMDNYAYVGNDDSFHIVDISNPQSTELVQSVSLGGEVIDVKITGSSLYILQSEELSIFDISDPVNPQYITGYSPPVEAVGITLQGDYAFLGLDGIHEGEESFLVLNISNPQNPYLVADYDYPWGCVNDVSIQANNIYLAANTALITLTADLESVNYGDANADGLVNVSDAVYIINYVFIGGDPPTPLAAGNVNCDDNVNVSDAVYIINYVFVNGPAPGDC